ncbi:DNA polymerase alpha subunit B [Paragonimus heterotremus]|uniref:DNA polymerase alpha subunit B n=1 Tax=Paragonimus heterotremus TaxID=100268 RepID=A0A8J4TAF5_9TREM|nr:DNA polymerase alpha subunit B [Paragonimus heterotremus]
MEDTDILCEELRGFGLCAVDGSVLEKLFQLGLKWNVDEVSLVEKYVAFQRTIDLPDQISSKHVEQFDREISARLESSKHKNVKNTPTPLASNFLPQTMLEELMATKSQDEQQDLFSSYVSDSNIPKLSISPAFKAANKENIPSLHTLSTTQKDDFICTYPQNFSARMIASSNRAASSDYGVIDLALSTGPARYMHQPALEKAEILDNWTWKLIKKTLNALSNEVFVRTDISAELESSQSVAHGLSAFSSTQRTPNKLPSSQLLTSTDGLERTSFLRPTCARLQTASLVAGRVGAQSIAGVQGGEKSIEDSSACIPTLSKSRLQPSTVGLIGPRRIDGALTSMDGLVRLEFPLSDRSLISYSLYAGQPVVIRATNPTGQLLEVTEVFSVPLFPPPTLASSKVGDLNVMIACGPYTSSDSNDSSLLLSLLRAVKSNRPHVFILIGPLVDCRHSSAQSYCETTFEELFQNRLNSIAEYCSHLDVQLLVVPSWREVHHDPVYPTPPIDQTWTQQTPELISWYKNVHFVWDPALLQIGDYVFGITSLDVLFDLSSEEISSGCTGDRIARLCRHLLCSESFYPVHPPSDELPLDYVLWDRHAAMSVTPHYLITPSRLRQFVKVGLLNRISQCDFHVIFLLFGVCCYRLRFVTTSLSYTALSMGTVYKPE